jgi:hypothetical protein
MMHVFRAAVGFGVAIVAIGGLWWFGTSALFRPLVPVEPAGSAPSAPAVDTSDSNPAGSNAPVASANDTTCASIEAQIRTIDERTRHPYTAQEGEDLRSHRHRLEAQRWRLRCGW